MKKLDTKTYHVPVELKQMEENGTFEGFAAVYGNVDLGGDVIEPGAFRKSVKERGQEILILHQHDAEEPIGLGQLEDRPEGLFVRGKLELGLAKAQEAYLRMKSKLLRGLSIGFQSIPSKTSIENGIRHLKEVRLFEISLVTFPMNERALIQTVKTRPVVESKRVVPFEDWPAHPDSTRSWDRAAAEERARAWVSDLAPAEWGEPEFTRYKRLHLWFDPEAAQSLGGYKFLLADVFDGEPAYVWNAARAALSVVRGGRGVGPSANWWSDRDAMESHLAKVYKKFDKDFPEKSATGPETKMDFLTALDQIQTYNFRCMMMRAIGESLDSILWDPALTAEEKQTQSDMALDQFHMQYLEFLPKLLALLDPESKAKLVLEIKAGRRLSAASRAAITNAIEQLQALLEEAEDDADAESTTTAPEAAKQHTEPGWSPSHSLLIENLDKLVREELKV